VFGVVAKRRFAAVNSVFGVVAKRKSAVADGRLKVSGVFRPNAGGFNLAQGKRSAALGKDRWRNEP
jgi:hypothetical protein